MSGRAALVTGGATGIGSEIVSQLAAQGSRVGFVDIDDTAARALVDAIDERGHPRPGYRSCDVRDVAALQVAIREIADDLGPITILVNNAANDQRHSLTDLTSEEWTDALAVNLRHHVFAAQQVAPLMRAAGGGSVINMGSVSWHVRLAGLYGYDAAKAGVEGITRTLARELGSSAIRVNCVIPGWVLTERQRRLWLTPEVERDVLASQCLAEMIRPEDVARLVLWLAADDSRLCTGQNWIVDAGWM